MSIFFLFSFAFHFSYSAMCKASSDNHSAFLHFFFLGMVSVTASCPMSRTSVHCSSGTLSDLISWIYLSLPLYNCKGIWFRSHLNGLMVSPTFFNLSLNFALRSSWSEPQSAPSLVFADCIELLHLWLLACYRTQGCKESDLPEWRNWLTILIVRFRIILRGSYSKDHSYFRNSKARFN